MAARRNPGHAHLEIERKYLLSSRPAIPQGAEIWIIRQGYLPLPRWWLPLPWKLAGRIRSITYPSGATRYFHTFKQGRGLVRHEHESEITASVFARHWPATAGRRLNKTRYRVPENGVTWEIDVLEGTNLVLAEVELPDVGAHPQMPGWLEATVVREVTDDPAYTNAAIAARLGAKSD